MVSRRFTGDNLRACATGGNPGQDHAAPTKHAATTRASVFDQLGVAGTEQVKGRGQSDASNNRALVVNRRNQIQARARASF